MKTTIFLYFFLLILTSCVTVGLPKKKKISSESYTFQSPPKNFKQQKLDQVDYIWKNELNANTISIYTHCDPNLDVTLQELENETLQAFSEIDQTIKKEISYNERSAIEVLVKGTVDGLKIELLQQIAIKNQCYYLLSYSGRETYFRQNIKDFENFSKGFTIK